MRIIGVTDAKVTPWIIGMRAPIFQKPKVCIRVAMPQENKSALIRWTSSAGDKCRAWAMMIGTATAPAYMARTCCRP